MAKGAKPERASVCHCGMCMRWAGGPWIAVFVDDLTFERCDSLQWIETSKWAQRAFCSRCGSSLFMRLTAEGPYHGTTSVSLGVLDDKSGLVLVKEWFIDRKPDGYAFAGERECITQSQAFAILDEGA